MLDLPFKIPVNRFKVWVKMPMAHAGMIPGMPSEPVWFLWADGLKTIEQANIMLDRVLRNADVPHFIELVEVEVDANDA